MEWLDRVGEGEAPSEGVSSGSGWLANRVMSVKEGRKRVSFGFVCFQVVLAYEVIVLCKCSGNVPIGYDCLFISDFLWRIYKSMAILEFYNI